MTNAYYNVTGNPATLARGASATIRAEFSSIAAGFALLSSPVPLATSSQNYALDTGSVNTVVVALPAGVVSYTDGMELVFKAAFSNTGATTITAGALGTVPITRGDATALQTGDYLQNEIIEVRYSSTDASFQMMNVGPAAAAAAATAATVATAAAAAAALSAASVPGFAPVTTSASAVAVAGEELWITASSAITVTLPAAPANGTKVRVLNTSTCLTHSILHNGNNIQGVAQDVVMDVLGQCVTLGFNTGIGWWRVG